MSRPDPGLPVAGLHLFRWTDRAVIGLALAATASGFGQFGVVAALADVSRSLGHAAPGGTVAEAAGLSGAALGAGLAVIRLASLLGLPLAGLADRLGRRVVLLVTLTVGLALTAASAASPSYWWFVVVFATGRPLLSATNALAGVSAGEQSSVADRARSIALVAAGYGVGAGLTAVVHGLAADALGFRGVLVLAVVPLALVPVIARWTTESDRFEIAAAAAEHPLPVLGAVERPYRRDLFVLAGLAFAVSVITGPANSFVFLYAQDVVAVPGALTAAMVVAAGATGLVGLLTGRWMADRVGRRPTAAVGVVGLGVCGVLAYSGTATALVVGYVLGVFTGSLFAPAGGALLVEVVPTSVRASVAGWWVASGVVGAALGLVAFGAVADLGDRFALAALVTFTPAVGAAVLLRWLPETKGREPEEVRPG